MWGRSSIRPAVLGRTCAIRDARVTGASVRWRLGVRRCARASDTLLTRRASHQSSERAIEALNSLIVPYEWSDAPVLVIGAGSVGLAAIQALRRKDIRVHLVERRSAHGERMSGLADGVFIGDAADKDVLMRAGLESAPSLILTTNDDAMNIYLAVSAGGSTRACG